MVKKKHRPATIPKSEFDMAVSGEVHRDVLAESLLDQSEKRKTRIDIPRREKGQFQGNKERK